MPKKESNPQNKRQWVISITTITLLAAAFVFYFLGYVKQKEDNLNARGFRILSSLGKNIESKQENKIKNAQNEVKDKGTFLDPDFEMDIKIIDDSSKYVPVITAIPNYLIAKNAAQVGDSTSKGRDQKLDTLVYRRIDYEVRIPLQKFMKNLIREDLFKDYIFMQNDTILYSTLQSGFQISKTDSLLTKKLGMQVSSIKEFEINGVLYKVYFQPYRFKNNQTWLLAGLIKKSTYKNLSMSISPTLIMLIFLVTALSLLSIPFIKLTVMSALERLNISDAVLAILSAIMGSSIVLIIILHLYRTYMDHETKLEKLEAFTTKISQEFSAEIDSAYKQLEDFDEQFEAYLDDDSHVSSANIYPIARRIQWVNSEGQQVYKSTQVALGTFHNESNLLDVKDRAYFSDVADGKTWKMEGKSFSFQSIYSWIIGKSMVAIGKESAKHKGWPDTKVVVLTSYFYSVIDPIIPLGYGFAIIDEKGDVLLHSDKSRNLQENFIMESDGNPQLQSAIYSRRNSRFKLDYLGKTFDAFIHPVNQLPLYVVGFRDQQYNRTVRAQTLNFTLLHTLLFFAFFIFMTVLSRILRFPASRLKKIRLLYGWIWPLERNKKVYSDIFYINCIITVALVIFSFITPDEEGITILYAASIFCFLFTFHRLNIEAYGKKSFRRNRYFLFSLTAILVAILIYSISNGFWCVWVFYFLVIAGFILTLLLKLPSVSQNHRNSYTWMVLSWLFIISIIPSFLFYRVSYNMEYEISAKHDQLDMARKIADNTPLWDDQARSRLFEAGLQDLEKTPTLRVLSRDSTRGDIHAEHIFSEIVLDTMPKNPPIKQEADYAFNKSISPLVRPFYNSIVVENNELVFDNAADESWWWKISKNKLKWWEFSKYKLQMYYSNSQLPTNPTNNQALVLTSSLHQFHLPLFDSDLGLGLLFWLVFVVIFFIGLPYLLKFSVQKIFAKQLLSSGFSDIDKSLFKKEESSKNVFLIGLPGSGKTTFLNKKYPPNPNILVINLIEVFYDESWDSIINEAIDPGISVVLVTHFEYNLENKELTSKKLSLLERLMLFEEKKIVVSAAVHLTNIEELYASDGVIDEDDREAIYRWTELFKNFYEVYLPLNHESYEHPEGERYGKNPNPLINDLISSEFNYGIYLSELKPEIVRLIEHNEKSGLENDHDQIVLKIQSLSAVYYHSLWSTCTENEKYVIYDLAEDGLVNSKNFYTIEGLLNKGLIICNDTLQVMNESFRNFVLTKIGPVDALKMERKAKKAGNWQNFRNPMVITLLALGAFLLLTQQDSLNSFFSFLTPFIAIIPALVRLSMLVGRRKGGVGGDDDD